MTSARSTLDPFPRLHIRPPRGWVNDPNGIGWWDGRWHVFFQHNPDGPTHQAICWGHASSQDLLTWSDEPVALRPRPGEIDALGVWSGVAVIDDDAPVLVYTAVSSAPADAGVALARRRADGTWRAESRLAARPDDPAIREARDPFVLVVEGRRYGLLGAGRTDGTPVVLLYDASDLDHWRLLGPLLSGTDQRARDLAPAQIWECPQLVPLRRSDGTGAWALILSLWDDRQDGDTLRGVTALVGELDSTGEHPRFVVRTGAPLDSGPDFYAPQAYDTGTRVLLWGWTWEGRAGRTTAEIHSAGWAGALTFPREVHLDGDRVGSVPARELTGLRYRELARGRRSARLEVAAWEAVANGPLRLTLESDDGVREVWRSGAGGGDGAVRVLVDGWVVEVFEDDRSHTVRACPRAGERWVVRVEDPATDLGVWQLGLPDG